jgi:hypothetical protein
MMKIFDQTSAILIVFILWMIVSTIIQAFKCAMSIWELLKRIPRSFIGDFKEHV